MHFMSGKLSLVQSASRHDPRRKSASADRNKGKRAKFLEFGPLGKFIGKEDKGQRLRPPPSLQRQDTMHKPGLRAMLYGLTLKMEREEKLQKKLMRKRAGGHFLKGFLTKF